MYAHAESQYLVTRILDVENELVVFRPVRHRLEEGHARILVGVENDVQRPIADLALQTVAVHPEELESRIEIHQHRELRVAMQVGAHHTNYRHGIGHETAGGDQQHGG